MKETLKPILIRLRPDARALLDRAADQQRQSRASIEGLIHAHLVQTGDVQVRLQRLLGPRR
jgi:hypothetical protein